MIEMCLIGPTEEVERATQFLRVPYTVISATDRVTRQSWLRRYLQLQIRTLTVSGFTADISQFNVRLHPKEPLETPEGPELKDQEPSQYPGS